MAFLLNKFFEAAKMLAKNRAVSKDPRKFQFETDINRLFLYTSYKRLGKELEDAEIDEIIDMGNKASIQDQQNQVQENIHLQVQKFCSLMGDILAVQNKNEDDSIESQPTPLPENTSSRPSGLSFAVGRTGSATDNTVVSKTNFLDNMEVSRKLKDLIGYTLEVKSSMIPSKEAGQGLFINGEAGLGSVIAFYPGMVYTPDYYRYIPGYPRVDTDNPYLVSRYDGTIINSKPWGSGGRTREIWKGVESPQPNHNQQSDRFWKLLSKPLEGSPTGCDSDLVELRNPLALGHYANHPGKGMGPNAMVCPYDFPLTEKEMRVYIPNVMFGNVETSMKRYGQFWFKSWKKSKLESPVLRTLLLVATRDICDEEVLVNYRLSNSKRRPLWYFPVDEDEDSRRWS